MKVSKLPGEFGFKALFKDSKNKGWKLTPEYYFSLEDLISECSENGVLLLDIKWPCEVWDDGSIYLPTKEELE